MALTKTTTIDELDSWQVVTGGTLAEGTVDDISDSYESILYLELAPVEAVATDGAEIIVEVSYADDDWTKLTTVKGIAETAATTTVNDATASAGDSDITLTDAQTGDFDIVGRKWLIKEATAANSESVRTKSESAHTVTLCQDMIRSHTNGASVYDRVDEFIISLPFAASYVRVLCNNVDGDCDCMFTTRISKVTALS